MKKNLTIKSILALAVVAALPVARADDGGGPFESSNTHILSDGGPDGWGRGWSYSAAAAPEFARVGGLGYSGASARGIGLNAAAANGNFSVDAGLDDLGGGQSGVEFRWLDATAGVNYSLRPPCMDRLIISPRAEIGRTGFAGQGAHANYLAIGGTAAYQITSRLVLAAQLMRGATDGATGATGLRGAGGMYQSSGLSLVFAHPFGTPGDMTLAYQNRRFFVDSLPGGDQYLRARVVSVGYSLPF